ncbi:MAG: phosphoribosylanthranilate isomerase [Roseococcus sp.]|nr:phosphoribosylanthranilate isomerase [Roseococcus sp.]
MPVEVKICGVNSAEALAWAAEAGADFVGFVFFPPSPRAVTPDQAAAISARHPGGPRRVGLFVDPDDATLAATLAAVPLDLIQLHGEETPERVAAVRARFGLPVMKALGIGGEADLAAIASHARVADRLLLDARPPPGAALPGGNAAPFDWALARRVAIPVPWLLAGGLTPGNVAAALAASGAPGVDVSSGVERARGVKDAALIRAFIAAARGASARG